MEIAKVLPLVLEASAQAAVGIGLLLIVRSFSSRVLPGRWLYLLWMVVMARLLLPGSLLPEAPKHLPHAPTVSFPTHYFAMENVVEPLVATPSVEAVRETVEVPSPAPVRAERRVINWWEVAGFVWLAGALGLAAYLTVAAWWFRRKILLEERGTPGEIAAIWDLCAASWHGPVPTLVTSAAVKSPVLVGLRRPRLVLPASGLEYLGTEDWEHIFLHELAHARRRDCWTNLLPLAALCVHWFNPLVWLGQRAIRADRELATDELVLRDIGEERSERYAGTLLRVLSGGGFSGALPGAIGIAESGAGLKRRFRRIVGYRPARMAATAVGLAMVGAVALLSFAQEKKAEEKGEIGAIRTAKDVQARLLEASRRQDTAALLEVLRIDNEIIWPRYDDANAVLEETARLDDEKAFVFLLNNLRRTSILARFVENKTRSWEPSEALLSNAIAKQQKEILAALLAYGIDPKLLAEAEKKSPPQGAFATWLSDEVKATEQKRAAAERLVKVARAGDIAAAQKELDAGTDINGAGDLGWTPLIEAVRAKKLEMAKFLLKHGANPNTPRLSIGEAVPLYYAQSAEMAQALKDAGGDINAKDFVSEVPIFIEIARGRPTEVVKWFIDQGVDPNMRGERWDKPTALFYVRKPETIKLLIDKGVPVNAVDDRRGESVLFEAVRGSKKSLEVVQTLLDNGADPNIRNRWGNVPIMNAPNAAAVELLIAHGADLTVKNEDGDSVLQFTGYDEDPSRREALARHGVKLNPKTEGVELLKGTVLSHDLVKAKELLAAGVDPDVGGISFQQYQDASSMSLATAFGQFDMVDAMRAAGGKDVGVLSQAAAAGDVAKVKELLANGASANEMTNMGQTPLSFALRRGQLETMRELLKAGADPNAISGWGMTDHIYAKFMEIQWKFSQSDTPVQFGKSPEEEAAFYPKAIALMNEYAKPEPNRKTAEGDTVLTIAASRGNSLSLYPLKEMGGDINYQRPDGMTAMMLAIVTKPTNARENMSRRLGEDGRIIQNTVAGSLVYNLLEMKADPNLRNKDGKTALDLARERNDREIIDMLENYTARQQAAAK